MKTKTRMTAYGLPYVDTNLQLSKAMAMSKRLTARNMKTNLSKLDAEIWATRRSLRVLNPTAAQLLSKLNP